MDDCIFCKVGSGEMKTDFVYQDEQVVAFNDVNPQAPVHILVIPIEHIGSVKDIEDESMIGHLVKAAKLVAEKVGLSDYRMVINTGPEAGQSVFHVHLHLLGGRRMNWPPG